MTRLEFTAPEDGTYHVVTGQPPHLLYTGCTPACSTLTENGSPGTVVVEFDTTKLDAERTDAAD